MSFLSIVADTSLRCSLGPLLAVASRLSAFSWLVFFPHVYFIFCFTFLVENFCCFFCLFIYLFVFFFFCLFVYLFFGACLACLLFSFEDWLLGKRVSWRELVGSMRGSVCARRGGRGGGEEDEEVEDEERLSLRMKLSGSIVERR